MTEQLFIIVDGESKQLDLNVPSGITLSFKSGLFGDFSKLEPSSSYSFGIPMTAHNKEVLGVVDATRDPNNTFGKKFKCIYLIDGNDICNNAYIYISKISKDACDANIIFNIIDGLKNIKDNDVNINEITSTDIDNNPNAIIKDNQINMNDVVYLEDEPAEAFVNNKIAVRQKFNCGIIDERVDYNFNSVTRKVGVDYGVVAMKDFDDEKYRIRDSIKSHYVNMARQLEGNDVSVIWASINDKDFRYIPNVIRTKIDSGHYVVPAYQILKRIEELYGIEFDFLEEKTDLNDPSISDIADPDNIDFSNPAIKRIMDKIYNDIFNYGVVPIVTTRMSEELENATACKMTLDSASLDNLIGDGDQMLTWKDIEKGLGFTANDRVWYEPYANMSISSRTGDISPSPYIHIPRGCDVTIKGKLYNIYDADISNKTIHLVCKDGHIADRFNKRERAADGNIDTYELEKRDSGPQWAGIATAALLMPHDPISFFITDVFGLWRRETEVYISAQTFEFKDDAFGSPWKMEEIDPWGYEHTVPSKTPGSNFTQTSPREDVRGEEYWARYIQYGFCLGNSTTPKSVAGDFTISVNWSEGKVKHWVDIYSCLPQISCIEFIKSLYVMAGAIPIIRKNGKIGIIYYSDLFENINKAKDWSNKFLSEDNISYRDDVSQHNYVLMHNENLSTRNKEVEGEDVFEGSLWNIEIKDSFLTKEKELYKLPYYGKWVKRGNAADYETGQGACVYQVEGVDEIKDFDYTLYHGNNLASVGLVQHRYKYTLSPNEMKPVFGVPTPYDTMEIWNVNRPNDKHLEAFRKLFSEQRLHNVVMKLELSELLDIDFSIPVYLSQYNSYFAIVKIDWDSKTGISKVQLIKINIDNGNE